MSLYTSLMDEFPIEIIFK